MNVWCLLVSVQVVEMAQLVALGNLLQVNSTGAAISSVQILHWFTAFTIHMQTCWAPQTEIPVELMFLGFHVDLQESICVSNALICHIARKPCHLAHLQTLSACGLSHFIAPYLSHPEPQAPLERVRNIGKPNGISENTDCNWGPFGGHYVHGDSDPCSLDDAPQNS